MDWNQLGKRAAARMAVASNRLFGSRADGALGILVYHSVAPHCRGIAKAPFTVSPKRFRRQLAGLLERGFSFRSLGEILALRREGKTIAGRTVVVTFDDGYENVFTHALPVLQELGVAATLFLSTKYLDHDGPFPFDPWGTANCDRVPPESYRPLRSEQCRRLIEGGLVELATHGHSHADFRGRPEAFGKDLAESRRILEERFGMEEVSFAFPYGRSYLGYVSDELMAAAREAQVTCALTTECDLVDVASEPFGWGRFNVYDHDTAATVAAKLGGWYGWAPRLQEWIRGQGAGVRGQGAGGRGQYSQSGSQAPAWEPTVGEASLGCRRSGASRKCGPKLELGTERNPDP